MITNNKYKTKPLIVHNPYLGMDCETFWPKIKRPLTCTKPDELTVVTWNSSSSPSVLEQQLGSYKIDYMCLASGFAWTTNRIKPVSLLAAEINTPYVLGMDAYDVLIIRNLSAIIEKFKRFGCEVVYNATSTVFPENAEHEEIERNMSEPPFSFFNSGAFIGRTEYIKIMLSRIDWSDPREPFSDQFLIRQQYHKDSKIKIDYRCEIFQVCLVGTRMTQDCISIGKVFL